MNCPECNSTDIETLWVQPENPMKPYQRWWCLSCGISGVSARASVEADD